VATQERQRGVGKEVDTVLLLVFAFLFILGDEIFVILGNEFHQDVKVHAVVVKEEVFVVVVTFKTDRLLDSVGKDSVQQVGSLAAGFVVPADERMVGQVVFDHDDRHFAFQFQTQQVKLLQLFAFHHLAG
jgi:hypothetical protein